MSEDDRSNKRKSAKRSYASSQAHKKYRASYKFGQRKRYNTIAKDRGINKMSNNEELIKKLSEAVVRNNNQTMLAGEIRFSSIPSIVSFEFDESLKYVDFTTVIREKNSIGRYAFKDQLQKSEAEGVYNGILKDLKQLMDNFDSDFAGICKKYGLVDLKS